MTGVLYDLKDRKGAYRDALARAFADARANAAALAGSDLTLLRIRSVSSADGDRKVPRLTEAPPALFGQQPTKIDPGAPISVAAHVVVTYAVR